MLIYPAIDLREGRVVRLHQGDFAQQTTFERSPLDQAKVFADAGAEWLHVVDLDAARTGQPTQHHVIAELARESGLKLQVGGGVRSLEAARTLLDLGVYRVIAGSAMVTSEEFRRAFFQELGAQAVAGIDMSDGVVRIAGWEQGSGITGLALAEELEALGCETYVVTDIATDGTLAGPNLEMLTDWRSAVKGHLIASGGVGTLQHIRDVQATGCDGVIVGRALLAEEISIHDTLEAAHGPA